MRYSGINDGEITPAYAKIDHCFNENIKIPVFYNVNSSESQSYSSN